MCHNMQQNCSQRVKAATPSVSNCAYAALPRSRERLLPFDAGWLSRSCYTVVVLDVVIVVAAAAVVAWLCP